MLPTALLARLLRSLGALSLVLALVALMSPVSAGAQSDVDDPALLEAGEAIFVEGCAGCHGADGAGTDFGRPLLGIADQQPDRLVHIASVRDGKGGMPAFGDSLSDEEIDAAVAYVRLTFQAERSVDELPNTGAEPFILIAGASLLLLGIGLTEYSRRNRMVSV